MSQNVSSTRISRTLHRRRTYPPARYISVFIRSTVPRDLLEISVISPPEAISTLMELLLWSGKRNTVLMF